MLWKQEVGAYVYLTNSLSFSIILDTNLLMVLLFNNICGSRIWSTACVAAHDTFGLF
jgi:hypothetical protein